MIKISVVIPAYNEGRSIAELLNQLCVTAIRKPDQIVIVDAFSEDDTVLVVKEWRQKWPQYQVTLVELKSRAYPGKARNEGVKQADYDYLAFIDCGVFPEKNWLNELAGAVEQDPTVDLVWGRCPSLTATPWEKAFAINSEIKRQNRYIPSSLITKKAFIQTGMFREDLRAAEDLVYKQSLVKLSLKEVFVPATTWYSGYPDTFKGTFKKWRLYAEYNVRAGIYQKKLLLACTELMGCLIICGGVGVIFQNVLAIIPVLALLLLCRGLYPILHSPYRVNNATEFTLVMMIAAVMDAGRLWGLLYGLCRIRRKNPSGGNGA